MVISKRGFFPTGICIFGVFLILCLTIRSSVFAGEDTQPVNATSEGQDISADAEKAAPRPITINGDTVEFSGDSKNFSASGHVEVIYKDTKLTCDKMTVNTETKNGIAEGHARLEEKMGIIEGDKISYNFDTKIGVIMDGQFRANPYYGKAEKLNKVSDTEFIARRGYMTTCNLDNPHYRMKSSRMIIFPQDKVQTKDTAIFFGGIPVMYLPQYNHNLADPIMHVQLMPGSSKLWGKYLLTAWRYKLTDDISGRIFLDYRQNLGFAEGFGTNYKTNGFGKGDIKFYYTRETIQNIPEGTPNSFLRNFIRWRHKWVIDDNTDFIAEFNKIHDSKRLLLGPDYNILKDYFPREYEKDTQPLTYAQLHRSYSVSSLDVLLQKRTTRWYPLAEEKLPQINFNLPSIKIGETPFYFEDTSSYVNFNLKHAVPSPSWDDVTYNQFDTTEKFSLPARLAFMNFTPFISGRANYLDKSTYGATMETVFSGGTDATTKFYRVFNANTDFLGLNINGLRHIITPTATYTYSVDSSYPAGKPHIGGANAVLGSGAVLGVSNKLQTKRKNQKVDLLDLRVSSAYNFKTGGAAKRGGNLADFLVQIDLLPYSWMALHADTTYNTQQHVVSSANYDIGLNFGRDRSLGLGQRYTRQGSNEVTYSFLWRVNPKWRIRLLQRREFSGAVGIKKGLREQEYTITRDLHCWEMDMTYNETRDKGSTIWLIFRLKAFPEMEFDYNKSYNGPRPGSQSTP